MEPDLAGIVKSLTKAERAALQGRFAWTSPQEQDEGEARLYQLGLWNPRPKRNERLLTDLGAAVRGAAGRMIVESNVINFPLEPKLLCTIAITRFPDGSIRAGFEHMPKPVIEMTGGDVAERVAIVSGWILDAAVDMERQAKAWAEALYGEQ